MTKTVTMVYLDGKTDRISYQNKPINSGADGAIYACINKKLALKIYHDPDKDTQRQDKLWEMLSHAPTTQGFSWPIAVLSSRQGVFIGYAMPLLDLSSHHTIETLLSKRSRDSLGITESYQFRLNVAISLAEKVAELHRLDHHIIDLKPANLSFDQFTGDVVILDCDGFSIKGNNKRYSGHQYTAGYIAPEAYSAQSPPEKLGINQDLFALATILFQLLNNGLHPFQGVPRNGKQLPTDNQAKIAAGIYGYAKKPHAKIKPSPWTIHSDFPDDLLQAFTQSLISNFRIKATVWKQLLKAQSLKLKACNKDNNHAYWQLKCPHCLLNQVRIKVSQKAISTSAVPIPPSLPIRSKTMTLNNHTNSRSPLMFVFCAFVLIIVVLAFLASSPNTTDLKSDPTVNFIEYIQDKPSQFTPQLTATHSLSGNVTYSSIKRGLRAKPKALGEIPFYQLTGFESSSGFPLLKYTPFGSIFLSTSQGLSLKQVDFNMAGKDLGQLDYRNDRLYQLEGWQYDSNSEKAYVYNCKYNPAICTHVTQVGIGKRLNYKFNDFSAEKIYPDEKIKVPEHSYRPWRFSLTPNGKKLVMASNFELVVYNVNNPKTPLIKQKLPAKWSNSSITRLLSIENGQRLIMSFANSQKYGLNYQGFVVELTLINGSYQVTTDFSSLAGANLMSGVDVATNSYGNILAIGEYIEPEINNNSYTSLNQSIEVTLAYPTIRLWKKTAQDWQPINSSTGKAMMIKTNKLKADKVLVKVPTNISDSSPILPFTFKSKLMGDLGVNRGFMLNQMGDTLLTGVDATTSRENTYAKAFLYKLDLSTNRLLLTAKIAKSYSYSTGARTANKTELTFLNASLSNDGKQVAFGRFVFSDIKSPDRKTTFSTQEYQLDLFNVTPSF